MEEKDFCDKALDHATERGAEYADVRLIPLSVSEDISVKNGVVENLEYSESAGFGVRVLLDGAWGFASSSTLSEREVARVVDLAISIARASVTTKQRAARLASALIWKRARYVSPVEIDPFRVSLEEKVDLL
ncbi:MAG TPA: DNA gyrase modulator, partial [Acidobacteriota bacterium]|nr:DNA gyrase modulator [Acidobacteriota bacterium]